MAKDKSKEIDTKVCENISHFAVGVHGATDHFCRDSRQEKSSSQYCRFHLLLTLKGKEKPVTLVLLIQFCFTCHQCCANFTHSKFVGRSSRFGLILSRHAPGFTALILDTGSCCDGPTRGWVRGWLIADEIYPRYSASFTLLLPAGWEVRLGSCSCMSGNIPRQGKPRCKKPSLASPLAERD